MADCHGCTHGWPTFTSSHTGELWHELYDRADLTHEPCTRGPIERELRKFDWVRGEDHELSSKAFALVYSVIESSPENWKLETDIASEAIEAAAALHEKGLL